MGGKIIFEVRKGFIWLKINKYFQEGSVLTNGINCKSQN